jgi:hypothetical protein
MQGLWTIVFNAFVFVIACALLAKAPAFPLYKMGIVMVAAAMYAINLYCMLLIYTKDQERRQLMKKQKDNIVPSQCPDFWNKSITTAGVMCKNEFASNKGGNPQTVVLGPTTAPKEFNLRTLTALNNQQKCDLVNQSAVPWVDMHNKCSNAGV